MHEMIHEHTTSGMTEVVNYHTISKWSLIPRCEGANANEADE